MVAKPANSIFSTQRRRVAGALGSTGQTHPAQRNSPRGCKVIGIQGRAPTSQETPHFHQNRGIFRIEAAALPR